MNQKKSRQLRKDLGLLTAVDKERRSDMKLHQDFIAKLYGKDYGKTQKIDREKTGWRMIGKKPDNSIYDPMKPQNNPVDNFMIVNE